MTQPGLFPHQPQPLDLDAMEKAAMRRLRAFITRLATKHRKALGLTS